ncbi:hypothetical protein IQ269_25490 [Tychonema sp. LEGE 07199]|nr:MULTISPECIES: hypothetical protein [unclassified Tychonema]MBE9124062.1 hypothetical protein [Tychonema sp. LEGE 07199]MBE9133883.1 hypothetical protein [Tychonema sp. LEGE 07196]
MTGCRRDDRTASAKFWIVGESQLLAAIDFAGDRSAVGPAGFPVADF